MAAGHGKKRNRGKRSGYSKNMCEKLKKMRQNEGEIGKIDWGCSLLLVERESRMTLAGEVIRPDWVECN